MPAGFVFLGKYRAFLVHRPGNGGWTKRTCRRRFRPVARGIPALGSSGARGHRDRRSRRAVHRLLHAALPCGGFHRSGLVDDGDPLARDRRHPAFGRRPHAARRTGLGHHGLALRGPALSTPRHSRTVVANPGLDRAAEAARYLQHNSGCRTYEAASFALPLAALYQAALTPDGGLEIRILTQAGETLSIRFPAAILAELNRMLAAKRTSLIVP